MGLLSRVARGLGVLKAGAAAVAAARVARAQADAVWARKKRGEVRKKQGGGARSYERCASSGES